MLGEFEEIQNFDVKNVRYRIVLKRKGNISSCVVYRYNMIPSLLLNKKKNRFEGVKLSVSTAKYSMKNRI